MTRVLVSFRIHRNRLDAHLPRRLDDTTGNLSPVGNQDFVEHGSLSWLLAWPMTHGRDA
jgi:hypothetical protein